ncbi:hypothetical protein M422DRAFT_257948 [Sphaerobolus stellatus SS14]|uniref:Uncharacterized protein n=1 Tax=Sphaerobolus stellatus (strain SS14) TaxID=990650 RepID=A0A0C9VNL3_SPHS4|nr:hypothetical protein M422DRAFT_257948 [Sphaerobolus stellatus SS14]
MAIMAAHIRVHIRPFNVRVRGVDVPRSWSLTFTPAYDHPTFSRYDSRQPTVYLEGDPSHHGRSSSRPHSVYVEGDTLALQLAFSRSRTPVSVIRRGSGSRTPSPERAIITPRSSSRASRSSRHPKPVVCGDSSRQSWAPSRAHSRGPTIIDHDRGPSGRHTRPPSIYSGDPEYPHPHPARSRPPSIFGDPDYIDQRSISAPPHRPHSHAESHRSPINEDFADAHDSPRRPIGSHVGSHAGSRAPSAYADGDRRPVSPQRSHVATRAPSEDYADALDPRRPSRASSRAHSRVSHVPPGRASPVHVVVPTSHRTTPPFTEGNVPRDRVQHPTEYEQDHRASRASHCAPEGQPTRYTSEEDAPAPTIVTVRRGSSRSRTPGAHTLGTRPPSHAQATAIPSGSQPSDIHVRFPDYGEAGGGSRRPSRAPTEIHPDHPEYDDGGGRQPSRALTAIPLGHPDYDGGQPTPATRSAHDERLLPVETFGDELEQTIVHGSETPPFIPLGSPSVVGSIAPSRHSVVPSRPTSRIVPSEGGVTAVSGSGPISEADREELSPAAEDTREEAACHAEQEREAAVSEAEQERQEEALHAESERAALSEKAGSERLSSVASIALSASPESVV